MKTGSTKAGQWRINKQSQIEHSVTRETSEFGFNGELYDVIPQGDSAGFSVVMSNTVLAGMLIQDSMTQYEPGTLLEPGEELVLRRPINELDRFRSWLKIPDLEHQLAIANRS